MACIAKDRFLSFPPVRKIFRSTPLQANLVAPRQNRLSVGYSCEIFLSSLEILFDCRTVNAEMRLEEVGGALSSWRKPEQARAGRKKCVRWVIGGPVDYGFVISGMTNSNGWTEKWSGIECHQAMFLERSTRKRSTCQTLDG
ncbi:hypothetical protein AVEN_11072-1 [Araneus ventricosus]|uniref:Uncharacterized protein n=1 Tax=Araneus ventricosus TaxID=182803 RepID=A0A4Y2QDD3_ARAVE|nr:hypothetical protein AVEN_11072-1 [Araneus ventricosus]